MGKATNLQKNANFRQFPNTFVNKTLKFAKYAKFAEICNFHIVGNLLITLIITNEVDSLFISFWNYTVREILGMEKYSKFMGKQKNIQNIYKYAFCILSEV